MVTKKKAPSKTSADRFWSESMKKHEPPDTPRKTASRWQENSFLKVINPEQYEWWETTLLTRNEFVGILLKIPTEVHWGRVERDKQENGEYIPGVGFVTVDK